MRLNGEELKEVIQKLQTMYGLVSSVDERLGGDRWYDLAANNSNAFPYLMFERAFHQIIDFPKEQYEMSLFNLQEFLEAYQATGGIIQLAKLHERVGGNIAALNESRITGKIKNQYVHLLYDLLDELRIRCDKTIVRSDEIRSKVQPLLATSLERFVASTEEYERLTRYAQESVEIERELGGNITASQQGDYWEISFSEPDLSRLWNQHITSYETFLKSNSNGHWHTHHTSDVQLTKTKDNKAQVAFSDSDFHYFEGTQIPSVVGLMDQQRHLTLQIMVGGGVYVVERMKNR